MKKLLLLFFITAIFFVAPKVPFSGQDSVSVRAVEMDYVDRDFPDAMDAAKKDGVRDMNKPGNDASTITNHMSDIIRRIGGPVIGITTNSTDLVYLEQMYKESFVAGAESVVSYVYTNPPANTYAFVRDMGESLGFIPKSAYAQGIGFSGLSQLLPIWKAFRNIAYLILAIFMIIVGFFIMFRKKIDPKTVITVQNALPNIVVTLLLITFSYAIVGIMIDFMYLIIVVAISILEPISNEVITPSTINIFVSGNFIDVMGKLWAGGLEGAIGGFLGLLNLKVPTAIDFALASTPIGVLALFLKGGTNLIGGMIVTQITIFFFVIAFLFAVFRLLILLIKSYIQIIMSVLISPFQLLLGAFPGSQAFEGWIKNLIANLAVFPITAIMILIGSILAKPATGGTKLWGPPMLNPGGSDGMTGIIGLGIIFAIPSIAGSIKEALKVKSPVGMGGGNIITPMISGGGQIWNLAYQAKMMGLWGKANPPQVPVSKTT